VFRGRVEIAWAEQGCQVPKKTFLSLQLKNEFFILMAQKTFFLKCPLGILPLTALLRPYFILSTPPKHD